MVVRNNRLIADNGMKLVNVDNSIAEEVWLSPSDNINNWREVTEAEALAGVPSVVTYAYDEEEDNVVE